MGLADIFYDEVVIRREFFNTFYFAMAIIMAIAIFLAYRYKLMRFGAMLWLSSGTICLLWEVVLFATGARHYNFMATLELLYHALTEAGPGLIIMAVAADRWGIADLEDFKDHNWKKGRDRNQDNDPVEEGSDGPSKSLSGPSDEEEVGTNNGISDDRDLDEQGGGDGH